MRKTIGRMARVSNHARTPGTAEWKLAIREFVGKMGGPLLIIEEIAKQQNQEDKQSLFSTNTEVIKVSGIFMEDRPIHKKHKIFEGTQKEVETIGRAM